MVFHMYHQRNLIYSKIFQLKKTSPLPSTLRKALTVPALMLTPLVGCSTKHHFVCSSYTRATNDCSLGIPSTIFECPTRFQMRMEKQPRCSLCLKPWDTSVGVPHKNANNSYHSPSTMNNLKCGTFSML